MRNLKRVLSLTLASVMLMGMMVVGSSAAKGYDDVSETDNVEAIEVLQAIEVMVGDERGFGPERPVNRAEMAVVMGKLLSLDYNYYTALCPFTDVYDWAQGWVGACYANKIVSGRGDGIYDPGATVTAVEAASMLMRALGYFQYQNDYADGFELATVTQGKKIGIFDNVGSSATEPMTRNQVAQMVLNALRSAVVEPDGNTINLTTPDGTVLTGKVNYVSVTSKKDFAHAISWTEATSIGSQNTGWIVELGERLYDGDLQLNDRDQDHFGRPARTWEYNGKEIGTYAKYELLREEYTVKVTGKMLYERLTENTIKNYTPHIAIDGTSVYDEGSKSFLGNSYFTDVNLIRTNTEKIGDTDKGVLTQVFVDPTEDNGAYYIAVINTYLAKATADYNEKKDEVDFTVYGVDLKNNRKSLVKDTEDKDPTKDYIQAQTEIVTVSGDDFDIKDVKKDDIVLVRVADEEIVEIIAPEVIEKTTINAFKLGSYVSTNGTQYDYADTALYDEEALGKYSDKNLKDLTYNIFLDPYGYLIGLEQNEDPDRYLFVTGSNGGDNNLKNQNADVSVIFLDGTMDVVEVNVKDSDPIEGGAIVNSWYTYTVNSKGVYTLEKVPTSLTNSDGTTNDAAQWAQNVTDGVDSVNGGSLTSYTIDKGHTSLLASSNGLNADRRVYGNDKSVYINVSTDVDATTKKIFDTAGVSTGNGISNSAYNSADTGVDSIADSANYFMSGAGSVTKAVIIDDVESVTVGLANASIETVDVTAGNYPKVANAVVGTPGDWYGSNELAVPKSEIYTLYNDDHYVIAAVVIGEDQGAAAKYVYVTSSKPQREEWVSTGARDGDEGYYIWEREVVLDGKITILTEVEDDNYSKIDTKHMTQGEWYKVSFDADNHVRKVTPASQETKKYATSVGKVETNYDDNKDTILLVDYKASPWLGQKLEFEGGTLYTNKARNEGFVVDGNVNVVYANAKMKAQNTTPTGKFSEVNWLDEVEWAGTGHTALTQALKKIDSDSTGNTITEGNFVGVLAAIIEDGRATSIIINDTLGAELKTGETLAGGGNNQSDGSVNAGDKTILAADGEYGTLGTTKLGKVNLTLNFKAPAWAEGVNEIGDIQSFKVAVKEGTEVIVELDESDFDAASAVTSGGVYTFTGKSNSTGLNDVKDAINAGLVDASKLTATISKVEWANANVKYVYDTKDGDDASGAMGTISNSGDSFESMKVGAATAGFKFTFTLPATRQLKTGVTNASYEIVNAEKAATEGTATSGTISSGAITFSTGLKAKGDDFVYVIIKDTEPKPATVLEDVTVAARATAKGKVEFLAVDSDKVPTTQTELDALTGWTTADQITAKKTQVLLIRSADRSVKLESVTAADPNGGVAPTIDNEVITDSGVFKHTLTGDVNITGVTTDGVEVTAVYVSKNMDKINAIIGGASTDNNKKAKAVVDYINSEMGTTYSAETYTVGSNTDYAGIKITHKTSGNTEKVAFDGNYLTIDVAVSMTEFKVNDTDVIIGKASNDATVKDALDLENIAIEGTKANVFVVLVKADGSGYKGVDSQSDGSTGGLDTVIDDKYRQVLTNGKKGYALADDSSPITIDNTTPVYSVANVTFTGTFKETQLTEASTGIYLPIGESVEIEVTLGGESMTTANTSGIKFVADTVDKIVHDDAVGGFGQGAIDKNATDGSNKTVITVKINSGNSAAGSIKLKAAEAS